MTEKKGKDPSYDISRLLDDVMDVQDRLQKQAKSFHTASSEMRRRMNLKELMHEEKAQQLKEERKNDLTKEIRLSGRSTGHTCPVLFWTDRRIRAYRLSRVLTTPASRLLPGLPRHGTGSGGSPFSGALRHFSPFPVRIPYTAEK